MGPIDSRAAPEAVTSRARDLARPASPEGTGGPELVAWLASDKLGFSPAAVRDFSGGRATY